MTVSGVPQALPAPATAPRPSPPTHAPVATANVAHVHSAARPGGHPLLVLAAACALMQGCYALRNPPALADAVRIEVISNQGRLVRTQAYLVDEIAQSLQSRLGWRISPDGAARLQLVIREEVIRPVSRDQRGIPAAWNVEIRGRWLLTTRNGHNDGSFAGNGYDNGQGAVTAGGLNSSYAAGFHDEDDAAQSASSDAAFGITNAIEDDASHWK